jgi:nicotinamide-nucleotide amidase
VEAELLVTGDEIVRGAVVDTNSGWLLQRLTLAGVRVRRVVAVGDVREDLFAALQEGARRSELLVISGGLGPTSDDLTAEIAAEAAGVGLRRDEASLARLHARWAARGRTLPPPPAVERQAMVPEGAEALANDEGTAPGFRLRLGGADCFFFAGVPREFRHLCERHLLPAVAARRGVALATRTLRCFGLTESELDARLLAFATGRGLRLGLRAAFPEAWATLAAEGATPEAAAGMLDSAVQDAQTLLEDACFSTRGESLAEVVGRLCVAGGATLAVAESCTGGLLGAALTAVAGSSRYFLGGALTYANEEKTRQLGVPPALLAEVGAVSGEVASAMAEGIRARTSATHALAITGVAGPGGGSAEKPVGTVWIGLAGPGGSSAVPYRFARTSRDDIRAASVAAALDLLRRELQGPRGAGGRAGAPR